jgi:hypothetical protein
MIDIGKKIILILNRNFKRINKKRNFAKKKKLFYFSKFFILLYKKIRYSK